MLCNLTNLKDKDLDQIKSLESDLGITVLAFSCHDAPPATLEEETLAKIQILEKNLEVSLVALNQ